MIDPTTEHEVSDEEMAGRLRWRLHDVNKMIEAMGGAGLSVEIQVLDTSSMSGQSCVIQPTVWRPL